MTLRIDKISKSDKKYIIREYTRLINCVTFVVKEIPKIIRNGVMIHVGLMFFRKKRSQENNIIPSR